MFDFSFSELLLCFVVALVVLGPERLPGVARGIGRWTGRARTYMRNLSAELDRESSMAELKQQLGDARRILDEESTAMKRSFEATAAEGRALVDDVRQTIAPPPAAEPNPPRDPHDGAHAVPSASPATTPDAATARPSDPHG